MTTNTASSAPSPDWRQYLRIVARATGPVPPAVPRRRVVLAPPDAPPLVPVLDTATAATHLARSESPRRGCWPACGGHVHRIVTDRTDDPYRRPDG